MDDHDLVQYFADLAGRLMGEGSVDGTMDVIVQSAVEVVDGCDHASISRMRGRSLVSASSNGEVGRVLDGIQTGAEEGPCLDSIRTGEVVATADLSTDERWPTYGPRAVESVGVHSSLAVPLHDGRSTIGALNLFGDQVGSFQQEGGAHDDEAVATILAAHAAPALAAALQRQDLQAAIRSRDVIGQAKGLLMARTGVDEDAAFELLKAASQRMNTKLAEVAQRLVDGSLVEAPRHGG